MEVRPNLQKISNFLQKYKYVALVIVIGIALMLIPSANQKKATSEIKSTAVVKTDEAIEEELAEILNHTAGVGRVKVLLTRGKGEETIYQTDTDTTNNDTERVKRSNTITITDADRNQTGLVRQINPPTFLGAVVVCQGADDPQVRLKVIDAVSKATGLGSNCISVLKMK